MRNRSDGRQNATWGGLLARISLLAAVSVLMLLASEVTVRVLENTGVLDRKDTFDNAELSGAFRWSKHPELVWELDPAHDLTNPAGFRGREYPREKPLGHFRIIAIGDSVTFGRGVTDAETFSKQLESILDQNGANTIEVLNFGVGGYNSEQEAELYRLKAREWQADLILLTYVLNDPVSKSSAIRDAGGAKREIKRGADSARNKRASSKSNSKSNLKSNSKSGPKSVSQMPAFMVEPEVSLFAQSRLRHLILDRFEAIRRPETRIVPREFFRFHLSQKPGWISVKRAFASLGEMTREDQVPVVLAILPVLIQVEEHPYRLLHEKVAKEAKLHGFHVVELQPDLARVPTEAIVFSARDRIHPNKKGHRIIAETLAVALKSLELVPLR